MSFVITAPEFVTSAAENLAGVGSEVWEATNAAAGSTTGIAVAAADEVSKAVSQLFGTYGREFQALSAQAAAFHSEFVRLLNGGAAAYASAEIANAEQTLLGPLLAPGFVPGGAYGQLVVTTAANLQSVFNTWTAHPFPFLGQVLANQQGYWRQIAAAFTNTIRNFPAVLANLPAAIQAGIQALLSANPALFVQQFISTQLAFTQTALTSLHSALTGTVAGLPAFEAGLQVAVQALAVGDYNGAVTDLAQAFANLLVTGLDPGNLMISVRGIGIPFNPVVSISTNPTVLGPLGDLLTLFNIPGQEAQYLTNLLPAGSIPWQVSQNLTNVLNALTIPSIEVDAELPLLNLPGSRFDAFFGLPLVLTYAVAGAPISALNGLATSATAFEHAVATGNGLAALGALVNAPAVVANGFLNSSTIVDSTIAIPTGFGPPLPIPPNIFITLHLPFDGILVPPHAVTATLNVPGFGSTTITINGTPFSGLVPLLVNFLPEQLAQAIRPPG